MLADSAQVQGGKLFILGAGWSQTTSPMSLPSAIGMIITVPWDNTNRNIEFALSLYDSDGQPVIVQTGPDTRAPLEIRSGFQVGRPPNVKQGTEFHVPFAVALSPIPLQPDSHYEWRLKIGDEENPDWRITFATAAAGVIPTRPTQ